MFTMWVADIDSPSYFVATAAVDLGFFEKEGIDVEFVVNTRDGPERLHDDRLDFIAGPAYCAARACPDFEGVQLLCALSQYSYWFLAVRSDLDVVAGDLAALKGLRISASPGAPTLGLRHMLASSGLDLDRDGISLVTPPPPVGAKGWMGRAGIDTLTLGTADAFWGNGLRVAMGEQLGLAKIHLDLRRGGGPPGARYYNFPAFMTMARVLERHPGLAAAAVRAIVKTQRVLQADPTVATTVASRHFPSDEAPLIAKLIARDAPFYEPQITIEAVNGMMDFALAQGLIGRRVAFEQIVSSQAAAAWSVAGSGAAMS